MGERIFDGLKVIDCASFIAGPAAATVMSDFGAEVIKIEPPGMGDPYRRRGTPAPGRPPLNPGFFLDARNKKSLALDLRGDQGRTVLYRLVANADVFITNYPPPARARLGITYADLAPLNPRLIYASFTGYGETGPEANKPGFDATAWWARTGLMDLVRAGQHVTPARSLPGMGDHPSSMGTYGAIVTALYQREKTGKGNYVSSSLLANGLWANGCSVQAALCGDEVRPQPPREEALSALRVHYQCRDDKWLLLSVAADEWRWEKFKSCFEDAAVLDDERFATDAKRNAHARELVAILDRLFAGHDLAHWRKVLDDSGIIFGIVAEVGDLREDEQVLAAGCLVPLTDHEAYTINSPFEIAGEDKVPPRRAPHVGEHSDEVLRSAGYADSEIAELRAAGVVA